MPPPGSDSLAARLRSLVGDRADLRSDSRAVRAGDAFAALPGRHADGRSYIEQACERGAGAILVEEDGWAGGAWPVPVLAVPGLARAMGPIASSFYGHPSRAMRTVGITGTNGKTSTCQWIAAALTGSGTRCAAFGTLGCGFAGDPFPGTYGLTTPQPADLHRLARAALDAGAAALALEASSIGLEQGRLEGFCIDIALFTNLSRDHLDYHGDMERYGLAKRRLFEQPGLSHAVVHADDPFGHRLAEDLVARGLAVTATGEAARTLARAPAVVLRASSVEHLDGGMRLRIERTAGGAREEASATLGLLGAFNAANVLGVTGVLLACGLPFAQAVSCLERLRPPPGRLEPVGDGSGGVLPVIDYAHTPDALEKALAALRPLAQARGGRLWVVFGAGGDRDRGKRPLMGLAAARGADAIVLTSDNPRSEPPEGILDEIAAGIPQGIAYEREADRALAIERALGAAAPRDVVLIAGKGHEATQEIAGRSLPFSDREEARICLRKGGGTGWN